jgi:pimeloyl-ACP methyl ester carboxylesterase
MNLRAERMTRSHATSAPVRNEADEPSSEVLRFDATQGLELDCGVVLAPWRIAYQTYGTLNADRSNAILLCHALTGDQHVANVNPVTGRPGWWETMVGPGKPYDTDRFFVICANVLGSCLGTSGPASRDGEGGKARGLEFPVVTVRDMVRAQARLVDHLGIETLFCVAGGSMGGMQVLQWAASYPERVFSAMPIAAAAKHSAQQTARHPPPKDQIANASVTGARAKAKVAIRITNASNNNRHLQHSPRLPRLPPMHQTNFAPVGKKNHLQWLANCINGPAAPHLYHLTDPTPAPRDEFAQPPIVSTAPCTDTTQPTMAPSADQCSTTPRHTLRNISRPRNPVTAATQRATTTCRPCVLASTRGARGVHTTLLPLRCQLRG